MALSQQYNHVTPVEPPVEPQPLTTLLIRRGQGRRTLPKIGCWRSAVTRSSTKGVEVLPPTVIYEGTNIHKELSEPKNERDDPRLLRRSS